MSDKRLGPCPFCGSETGLIVALTYTYTYWIQCDECGAEGPLSKTEAEAIARFAGHIEELRAEAKRIREGGHA